MATWVATGIELVVLTHAVRGKRNGWKSASECVRPFPDIFREFHVRRKWKRPVPFPLQSFSNPSSSVRPAMI
jgi:hypothetical protein